jgi:4'-phosphopantetheinyl transferase
MTGQSIPACEAPTPGMVPCNAAVEVWWYDSIETGPDEIESLARTLPAEQHAAAARFGNDVLRKRHIGAHAMMLDVLGCHADRPEGRFVLTRGSHGKPDIAGPGAVGHLRFNLAHSGAMAVVAIADGREIGVDIERVRPDIDIAGVARLCFTEREVAALAQVSQADYVAAFFSCWTRKEALLKAQGTGLMSPPADIEVGLGRYEPQTTGRPEAGPEGWVMMTLDLGAGYAGAIAVEGPPGFKLSLHRWRLPADLSRSVRRCRAAAPRAASVLTAS